MAIDLKNTTTNYGLIAILLHWTMALLIVGMFFLGLYMVDLDYYDPWYNSAPFWHQSFGISVFVLLILRLLWRIKEITPTALQSYNRWEVIIAKTVHRLFYLLIFVSCVSGYSIATAKGVGINVFDWFTLPSLFSLEQTQAETVETIHEITNWLIATLFILHVSAALKHHFINKDGTLNRILYPYNK